MTPHTLLAAVARGLLIGGFASLAMLLPYLVGPWGFVGSAVVLGVLFLRALWGRDVRCLHCRAVAWAGEARDLGWLRTRAGDWLCDACRRDRR